MIKNRELIESLTKQIKELSVMDQLHLIDNITDNNDYFLDKRVITKDTIIDELFFRLENRDEDNNTDFIKSFLEDNNTDYIFEIVKDCCNYNFLFDYNSWDENDEDILNYINFDENQFISGIRTHNRDKKLEELLG